MVTMLLALAPELREGRDSCNRSIAHAAACGGIDLDADSNYQCDDLEGWYPWHCAAQAGHRAVLEKYSVDAIFSPVDCGITCAHLASENGHADVLGYLKALSGFDLNQRRGDGKTPWLLAAACGSVPCLDVLYEVELINDIDRDGRTAIHLCTNAGAAQWLVEKNADIRIQDSVQWTPLHVHAAEGHKEIVDILIKAGADVLQVDEEGNTPRQCAMLRKQLNVIISLDNAAAALKKSVLLNGAAIVPN